MIYTERMSRSAIHVDPNGQASVMKRIPFMTGTFNEAWLQEVLADNPFIIPSFEVGSEYAPLVCIGREVPVGSGETQGYIDNLYLTPSGHIVIVETKLFRNQESRRTVVAQIIDYAKELQKWDCEMLNKVAEQYTLKYEGQAKRIIDIMVARGGTSYADEARLTDKINDSLKRASFLLMIIGDGIRSSVQQLADFLNENTSMAFNLALAEMEIYQTDNGVIVIPNLLAKTSVIERNIVSIHGSFVDEETEHESASPSKYIRKPMLTRREFITKFCENGGFDADEVGEFIADLDAIGGIAVSLSPTELAIKFVLGEGKTGSLVVFGIASNQADVWLVPGRIKSSLEKNGVFPFDADDFLDFYKEVVDDSRCKTPPYENIAGFYYADVNEVLRRKQDFIRAVEQFVTSIQKN